MARPNIIPSPKGTPDGAAFVQAARPPRYYVRKMREGFGVYACFTPHTRNLATQEEAQAIADRLNAENGRS